MESSEMCQETKKSVSRVKIMPAFLPPTQLPIPPAIDNWKNFGQEPACMVLVFWKEWAKFQISVLVKKAKIDPVGLSFFGNKVKRFAKQMLSDVINALACVYWYFLRAELNGCQRRKEELPTRVFCKLLFLRKAVKICLSTINWAIDSKPKPYEAQCYIFSLF